VAKDPSRPFIVTAGGVKVRAVGTVFDVRLGSKTVEVLVTEGRVRVNPSSQPAGVEPVRDAATVAVLPELTAGQHAVVSLGSEAAPPKIDTVSEAEMARMLAWQPRRLDFNAAPLSEIVAEFNRRNPVQMVVAEPELGALRISTSFRSDNVYGFVRLLEAGFDVRAEYRDGTAIVLHRTR
jgi:transmembrane sensor